MKQQSSETDEVSQFRAGFIARLNEVSRDFGPQHKLAESIGVSKGALQTWLGGRKAPGFEAIARLAQVTGVSLDWLAFGGDDRQLDVAKYSSTPAPDWMALLYSAISELYIARGWTEPPAEARKQAASAYFAVTNPDRLDQQHESFDAVIEMLSYQIEPPQTSDASQRSA